MRKLQPVLLSVIILFVSCLSNNNKIPANKYEKFVDGLIEQQKQMKLEFDSINNNYYCIQDFKKYLEYFGQLYVDSNWTLESHYWDFGSGGRPLLLAFKKNDSIANYLKLQLSKNKNELEGEYGDLDLLKELFDYKDSIDFFTPIHIKSDSGYFQFLIFAILGGNYCLYWHSNYAHIDIMTSQQRIKKITKLYYRFSKSEKEQVLKINPVPVVKFYNDSVTIKIVTFEPWDGFIERKFSITKKWPHKLRQYDKNVLVKYNCGIMF